MQVIEDLVIQKLSQDSSVSDGHNQDMQPLQKNASAGNTLIAVEDLLYKPWITIGGILLYKSDKEALVSG